MQLDLRLNNFDSATGELDPEGKSYSVSIVDLEAEFASSPKLEKAWDDLIDALSNHYEYKSTEDKINRSAPETDVSALVSKRDAALAKIQAPLT